MQKKAAKPPAKMAKKKKPPVKKQDQKFSLKRLIMGEEKPDLTELEAGSTTILDILSPTTIDTKSRDYIVVDGIFHAYLYVAGCGYSTCWILRGCPTICCSPASSGPLMWQTTLSWTPAATCPPSGRRTRYPSPPCSET